LIMDLTALGLMLVQRMMINRWFNWNILYSLLHPLGVCWYESLGVRVLLDYVTNESTSWKQRKI